MPLSGHGAALHRALFEYHPDPAFTLDGDGVLLAVNRAFTVFLGQPATALVGQPLASLVDPPQHDVARAAVARARTQETHAWQADFAGPDGTLCLGYVTLVPLVVDGALAGIHGVARDVTVYRVIEEQLRERVFTDPLTGLANRTTFHESLDAALRRPGAALAAPTVLLVGLDDLGLVTDALGHAAGDRVLVAAAERIRRATRGIEALARLDGGDFALLLERVASPEAAAAVAGRVLDALDAPLPLDGRVVTVRASAGVASWCATPTSPSAAPARRPVPGRGRSPTSRRCRPRRAAGWSWPATCARRSTPPLPPRWPTRPAPPPTGAPPGSGPPTSRSSTWRRGGW